MKIRIVILLQILISNSLFAQFNYWNQLSGEPSDSLGDSFTNVEIINDTIYTYGALADFNGQYLQLRKYETNCSFLSSNEFYLNDGIYYVVLFGKGKTLFSESAIQYH